MDLLTSLLWFLVVTPVVVHLHELGHAAAALRLTRDAVVVQACVRPVGAMRIGRLHIAIGLPALSGVCYHADAGRGHGNATIAAAGPLVSLVTGGAAGWAWFAGHGGAWLAAFAIMSLLAGLTNLLPAHVEDGAAAVRESDGRIILRSLGLARAPREDAPIIRWPFAVLLALVALGSAYLHPLLPLALAAVLGHAWWLVRRERGPASRAGVPAREAWDASGSVAPPEPR
jgi:hypothetical protein